MDEKIPGLNEVLSSGEKAKPAAAQPGSTATPGGESKAAPSAPAPQPAVASSFDFNQPTIVAGLYLLAPFFGITGLIGLVLAYVWRSEKPDSWEATHYTYLIRGFWIWFAACVIGFPLLVIFIGLFVLLAGFALVIVRAVLSIIRAQKQEPMPEPETWLV